MESCEINTSGKLNLESTLVSFLLSLIFVGLFLILQSLNFLNLNTPENLSLPFVFLIGIVASLSTCTASVGGLVLSLSATYAQLGKTAYLPLIKFHMSRLITFFIFGGLLGYLGSFFELSQTLNLIINTFVFLLMMGLGLNLLKMFPLPKLFKFNLANQDNLNLTPIILGFITFILPCGFTQAMQFYTLTLGGFWAGGLNMLVFSLGTLPALALISFASIKLAKRLNNEIFFKTTGFITIYFALFNFYLIIKNLI